MTPLEQNETTYEKPADLLTIDITPDPETNSSQYIHRKKFWVQRRRGAEFVTIGFPEPEGFISREVKLEELQEAIEELDNYEDEE
jgi:hypothetical protein